MKLLVVDGWDGQNNAGLGAVRALAAAGHEVDVAHAGRFAVAARSRHVSRRHAIPRADDASFAAAVRELVRIGGYAACFPTSDAVLVALGLPGAELTDKSHLSARARDTGVRHAQSRTFSTAGELLRHAGDLDFPLAVKESARPGTTAGRVWRADSVADLESAEGLAGPLLAESWLVGEQQAVSGVVSRGRLLVATHQRYVRTWPVDCGVACSAVTTAPDHGLEEQVLALLGDYEGIFQAQAIDGNVHDVNPRVFGSVALGVRAGANSPHVAALLAAAEPVPERTVRARAGVHYRWLEGDARHLRTLRQDGDRSLRLLVRHLRPVPGTVHPLVSWSDPAPALNRLRFAAGRGER